MRRPTPCTGRIARSGQGLGCPSWERGRRSAGAPIARFIPGIAAARTYERAWLPKDVVAGLVLTALLVPQGMAYAELAGLPAITGLYTSIMCLLAYAAVRSVEDPRPRSGLVPRPDDRGDDPARSSAPTATRRRPSPWRPCSPCWWGRA